MRLALAPKAVEVVGDEVVVDEVVGCDSSKRHLGLNEAITKLACSAR